MKKGKWSEEEVEMLAELYSDTENKEISRILNRDKKGVIFKAKKLGLVKDWYWTREQEELLKEIYANTLNSELSKIFNKSSEAIRKKAERLGLNKSEEYTTKCCKMKTTVTYEKEIHQLLYMYPDSKRLSLHKKDNIEKYSGFLDNLKQKYIVNHDYFETIDSYMKAYFLGFLWADGCVYKEGGSYRIQLLTHKKDRFVIEEFLKELNSNYLVRNVRENYVSVRFASEKMFKDLGKHGIIPRKTYEKECPTISDRFIASFIRGLFDGDGYISLNPVGEVSIANTETTCYWLLDITRKYLNVGGGVRRDKRSSSCHMWSLWGRHQVSKFGLWIYGDNEFGLNRKKQRFIDLGLLEI